MLVILTADQAGLPLIDYLLVQRVIRPLSTTMHVVVLWVYSLPLLSTTRPSAVATRRPM